MTTALMSGRLRLTLDLRFGRLVFVHEVKNEHCRGKADCDQESDEEIRSHSKGALRRIVAKSGLERYCRVRCSRRLFVFCDLIDPSPKRVVSRRFRCRTSANRLAAAIKDFGFVSAPPQRQLIEPIASNPPSPNFRAHTGIVAWRCDVETATSAKSPAQIGAGPIGRQSTQSGPRADSDQKLPSRNHPHLCRKLCD